MHGLFSHINLLEEVLHEDEDKKNTIKGLVTWALREFNEGYKCDKRMLNLWKLMVRFYSKYLNFKKTYISYLLGEIQRKHGHGWCA
jgi:hypothetical protein